MDAAARPLADFMTTASQRFIIPVYQRPYSWDEEQCVQLWDDILEVGRREGQATHFTGSIVWVQQGIMSAAGITPVLIIDGQQRVTTVTLLVIALAEYAREHTQDVRAGKLAFSYEEILDSKFLINKYKRGDDRYRLTLSRGDAPVLRALIDRLEDPECPAELPEGSRLVRNLGLFRRRLAALADPNAVWLGISRLLVVSVSLHQGHDNPQLIFESMNSTGKELSTADLIRNFVLMQQTAAEQERLYEDHWRVIERALGERYDEVFDEFIRNWLTVLYAPEPLVRRDVYALFKRHAAERGYDQGGEVAELLRELERYARYYAAITEGRCDEPALKLRLDRIARFGAGVANPLLLAFWDAYEAGAFPLEDFCALLDTVESYLFRRAVCDVATNSLNKFFSSLIARLARVRAEGGAYLEAFCAMLLNEAATARRFPSDAEFGQALRTRDSYGFRRSLYLLSRLENSYHPKDERDFFAGTYTIEHIMPQNALAHGEWRAMLGPDAEATHVRLVNTLGNLTLTAYNSELSDGSFAQKKARAVGGYDTEFVRISAALREAEVWDAAAIEARGEELAARALEVWPAPSLGLEVRARYAPKRQVAEPGLSEVTLADLFAAGLLPAGTQLTLQFRGQLHEAVIDTGGGIVLANGERFSSPSAAAIRAVELSGGAGSRNGWKCWMLEDGRMLDALRGAFVRQQPASSPADGRSATKQKLNAYWRGFYEYASGLPAFVEAFGDQSQIQRQKANHIDPLIGVHGCHPTARIGVSSGQITLSVWCTDMEAYATLHEHLDEFEALAVELGASFQADDVEEAYDGSSLKKSRSIFFRRAADWGAPDWTELYAWHATGLLRLRELILGILS